MDFLNLITKNSAMWKEQNNCLIKTYTFQNFTEAFGFMTKVALTVEKMDHHPNWSNSYNSVTIELTTHDKGNVVTEKDRKLATAIDQLI